MWTDEVASAVWTCASGRSHCDVLVDPEADAHVREWLHEGPGASAAVEASLLDPLFADAPERAPFVLRVPKEEFPLLERLAERACEEALAGLDQPRCVCGFIFTRLPLMQLRTTLTQALAITVEQTRYYFRYFDPRVFHHLMRLLCPEQLAMLLHGIDRWGFFLWDGRFVVHDVRHPGSRGLMPSSGFRLPLRMWRLLAAVEHFNATVALLARHRKPCAPPETERLFSDVCEALGAGLAQPHDVAEFVLWKQKHATTPSALPEWPRLCEQVRAGVPLSELLPVPTL